MKDLLHGKFLKVFNGLVKIGLEMRVCCKFISGVSEFCMIFDF